MLRDLLRAAYHGAHDLAFAALPYVPLVRHRANGRPVGYGHVSGEHLADPALDDRLADELRAHGVEVSPYAVDVAGFRAYLADADYPAGYFGGGRDPASNFVEKALEHYVSLDFLDLRPESTFVDVAACNSPFSAIVAARYGVARSYQQDPIYPRGVHGHQIGGWGHELPFGAGEVDAVTLHCALEHFEGDSDVRFFAAMRERLRVGGRVVVLPFYLAHEHTIHVDPVYNLLRGHRVDWRSNAGFRLRYAGWYQFFSRHYDPATLRARVLAACPGLRLTVYRVTNFREVDPRCYLRFVGVFERVA